MALAELGCSVTSERFVEAYLAEKNGHRVQADNPVQQSLDCGHDAKHAYRYAGELLCRRCQKVRRYEAHRENYLPDAIENTKRKLETLEREARERGVLL